MPSSPMNVITSTFLYVDGSRSVNSGPFHELEVLELLLGPGVYDASGIPSKSFKSWVSLYILHHALSELGCRGVVDLDGEFGFLGVLRPVNSSLLACLHDAIKSIDHFLADEFIEGLKRKVVKDLLYDPVVLLPLLQHESVLLVAPLDVLGLSLDALSVGQVSFSPSSLS